MIIVLIERIRNAFNRIVVSPLKKHELGSYGADISIGSRTTMTYKNVHMGNSVYVGPNCEFLSTRAKIIIGDHVIFGPNVKIITGDHRIDVLGKYISDVSDEDKKDENDQDVVFEGDNWIGANAIILKGSRIGFGAVIAAGTVVNKDVPDYAIVGGIPGKVLRFRFNEEQIREHVKLLKR